MEDSVQNITTFENTTELTSSQEDKIICDATLEEDFEDDSIIVVFKNSKSRNLEEYTTKSFPKISATKVNDLTSRSKKKSKDNETKIATLKN